MNAMPGVFAFVMLLLGGGGGNDLLDYVQSDAYWKQKSVEVSTQQLVGELATAQGNSALSMKFLAEGSDAEKVKQAVETSKDAVAAALKNANAAKSQGPQMMAVVQPIIDFLDSIKFEQDSANVTVTATLDSVGILPSLSTRSASAN